MKKFLIITLLGCTSSSKEYDRSDRSDTADTADTAVASDQDGDGVADSEDACPNDPLQWTDADGNSLTLVSGKQLQEGDLLMTTQLPNAVTGLLVEVNE